MAIEAEFFQFMLNKISISSWGVEKLYTKMLTNPEMDEEQKAILERTYNERKFYEVEILNHLAYDLIAKEKDIQQNALRDSISRIICLNNSYELTYLLKPESHQIETEVKKAKDSTNTNIILIKRQSFFLRRSHFSAIVVSNGAVSAEVIIEEDLVNSLRLDFSKSLTKEQVKRFIDPLNLEKFIASFFKINSLHQPFSLIALTKTGEILIPVKDKGIFQWTLTQNGQINNIYQEYSVYRFSKDMLNSQDFIKEGGASGAATSGNSRDVYLDEYIDLGSYARAGGAGAGCTSLIRESQSVEWVDPALKIFALLADNENELKIICAGTHDISTTKADVEISAGFESFEKNRVHFMSFLAQVMRKRAHIEDRLNISFYGHSLGGALAQLANFTILAAPQLRCQVASLTLAIKNPSGVPKLVSKTHRDLVISHSYLKHNAMFYYVDGDGVQQTGESSLFSSKKLIRSRNVKLIMAKASAPLEGAKRWRGFIENSFTTTGSLAIPMLINPASIPAAIAIGIIGGVFIKTTCTVCKLLGTVNTHRAKYFSDNLKDYSIDFYKSSNSQDRILLGIQLSYKSMLSQQMLNLLGGDRSKISSFIETAQIYENAEDRDVLSDIPPQMPAASDSLPTVSTAQSRVETVITSEKTRCHYFL